MSEYLSVQLSSDAGETEASFKSRLSALWSHMLRQHEAEFEKVYAETSKFTAHGDRLGRQYLFEAGIVDFLKAKLAEQKFAFDEIDEDEIYSKYEATPPEWFQLEH